MKTTYYPITDVSSRPYWSRSDESAGERSRATSKRRVHVDRAQTQRGGEKFITQHEQAPETPQTWVRCSLRVFKSRDGKRWHPEEGKGGARKKKDECAGW